MGTDHIARLAHMIVFFIQPQASIGSWEIGKGWNLTLTANSDRKLTTKFGFAGGSGGWPVLASSAGPAVWFSFARDVPQTKAEGRSSVLFAPGFMEFSVPGGMQNDIITVTGVVKSSGKETIFEFRGDEVARVQGASTGILQSTRMFADCVLRSQTTM